MIAFMVLIWNWNKNAFKYFLVIQIQLNNGNWIIIWSLLIKQKASFCSYCYWLMCHSIFPYILHKICCGEGGSSTKGFYHFAFAYMNQFFVHAHKHKISNNTMMLSYICNIIAQFLQFSAKRTEINHFNWHFNSIQPLNELKQQRKIIVNLIWSWNWRRF